MQILELIFMNDCQLIIAYDKSYSVKENHIILNLSSVHKGILKFRYGQTFRCTFKIHCKAKKVQSFHSLRMDVSPLRRRILLADCRKP